MNRSVCEYHIYKWSGSANIPTRTRWRLSATEVLAVYMLLYCMKCFVSFCLRIFLDIYQYNFSFIMLLWIYGILLTLICSYDGPMRYMEIKRSGIVFFLFNFFYSIFPIHPTTHGHLLRMAYIIIAGKSSILIGPINI